jgi:hypothetical protein
MAKISLERIVDIINLTRQLAVDLRNLTFLDNFVAFEEEIEIAAGTEVSVRNQLNLIPTRYIIVSQTGDGLVTKGDTEWTSTRLYLKNNGSNDVTVKVTFFK